jgi:prepilin-type N-terminal cleavage/methylation domain-containing protein
MRPHRPRPGFTLVEMMAASVITGFIAVVAIGGLVSVTSTRSSLDEVTETMDELRYAADMIRQDMANVYRDRQEMLFEGAAEEIGTQQVPRLRFRAVSTAKARRGPPEGDVYEIEYLFFAGSDGKARLSRRVCPVVGIEVDHQQTAGGILTQLSERISLFGVRYFNGTEWTTIWPIEQMLPTLMEVSMASPVIDKKGKQKIYAKQVIVTFPRRGVPAAEEDQTSLEVKFTEPEAGLDI